MAIGDKIRDEKLQYDINRVAAKIYALLSGKINKYEYLAAQEILPRQQQQIIEESKFTYSLLRKALEKHIETVKEHGKKQTQVLKSLESPGRELSSKKSFFLRKN